MVILRSDDLRTDDGEFAENTLKCQKYAKMPKIG